MSTRMEIGLRNDGAAMLDKYTRVEFQARRSPLQSHDFRVESVKTWRQNSAGQFGFGKGW